ncbi:MAG: AI-2E family transporter, partial [Opitutales bacterium]
MICFAAAILFVSLLGLVTWALARAFTFFGGVIWPLAVAGILSIMLRPMVAFFEERFRLGRAASVLALYALVIAASAAGMLLVAPTIVTQIDALSQSAPHWPGKIQKSLEERLPEQARGIVGAVMLEINESWGNVFDSEENATSPSEIDGLSPQEQEKFLQRQGEMERNRMLENLQKQGGALAEKAGEALRKAKTFLFAFFQKITFLAIIPIYM